MKKCFRLVVKVLFTPVFCAVMLSILSTSYIMSGWLWLFDKYDDLKFNQLIIQDMKRDIKKWFTTI